VKPGEYRRSQIALDEWPLQWDIQNTATMTFAHTLRSYYNSSIRAATEKDTDFFNALCEFNFGLLTEHSDEVIARSLMSYMHTWVSLFPILFVVYFAYARIQDWGRTPAGPHFVRTKVMDETVDNKLLCHLSMLTNGRHVLPIDIHEPVVRLTLL